MIKKEEIENKVRQEIENTDAFLVSLTISPEEDIVIELDSPTGVDLDFCEHLTRLLNAWLPQEEDYSLEVGSASLSAPFKVTEQYLKHIDDPVEVLTADGRKLRGILSQANEKGFTLLTEKKEKVEGKKRPEMVTHTEDFPYDAVKEVKYWFK